MIPREDRDIATNVQEVLEKKGIRFILNANVQSVLNNEKEAVLTYKNTKNEELHTLKTDAILLATAEDPTRKTWA